MRQDTTVLKFIQKHDLNLLESGRTDNLGIDAQSVATEVHSERSNVSRILNLLHRDGKLIKILGRPTEFVHKYTLQTYHPDIYFPSTVQSKGELIDILSKGSQDSTIPSKNKNRPIGTLPNESLEDIFNDLSVFAMYPNPQIYAVISGDISESLAFTKDVLTYHGYEVLIFDTETPVYDIQKKQIIIITESHPYSLALPFGFDKLKKVFLTSSIPSRSETPFTYVFPNFNNKTLKEKLSLALHSFQKQSDITDRTYTISIGALNCFITAKYQNRHHFENEIIRTCAFAFNHAIENNNKIITVGYEHISDSILNSITNISDRMHEINSLYQSIPGKALSIIPSTTSQLYQYLTTNYLNESNILVNRSLLTMRTLSYMKYKEILTDDMANNDYYRDKALQTSLLSVLNPIIGDSTIVSNIQIFIKKLTLGIFNPLPEISDINEIDTQNISPLLPGITDAVSVTLNYILNKTELDFVSALLVHLTTKHSKHKTPIFILCHGNNLATSYEEYVRNTYNYDNIYALNYSIKHQSVKFESFLTYVYHEISLTDYKDGIILVADMDPLISIDSLIEKHFEIPVSSIYPISLPLLIDVAKRTNNHEDPQSIQKSYSTSHSNNAPLKSTTADNTVFMQDVIDNILTQSLIFLNPQKATQILTVVLHEILTKLKKSYNDQLAIRFIFHSSFVIERAIRNQQHVYKQIRNIVRDFPQMFNIVEKEFQVVNRAFGIKISPDEISIICEIFIEDSI